MQEEKGSKMVLTEVVLVAADDDAGMIDGIDLNTEDLPRYLDQGQVMSGRVSRKY